jgi:hypothetical protein
MSVQIMQYYKEGTDRFSEQKEAVRPEGGYPIR